MRAGTLTGFLGRVAALATAVACGQSGDSHGVEVGDARAIPDVVTGASDVGGGCPAFQTVATPPAIACALAQSAIVGASAFCQQAPDGSAVATTQVCETLCPDLCLPRCVVPASYMEAFNALNDAGHRSAEAGTADAEALDAEAPDAGCPSVTGTVPIECASGCAGAGRRTAGVPDPELPWQASPAEYFGACAHLEAVSVHAFERLAEELEAHGAPANLIASARRAGRDETRHAALMTRLARTFDPSSEAPIPAAPRLAVRTLGAIAKENAIEGCVGETYGAALALLQAERAPRAETRAALRSIARDECRHAELSWRVAAWAMPRLESAERRAIACGVRAAVARLARARDSLSREARTASGMPTTRGRRALVSRLDRRVFSSAFAASHV